MSKLPVIKDHEMLAVLLRAGFSVVRWGGTSHAQLAHPHKPGVRITIAIHHRDMHRSEIRKTLRDAQVTIEEFRSFSERVTVGAVGEPARARGSRFQRRSPRGGCRGCSGKDGLGRVPS